MTDICACLAAVKQRIAAACERAGRDPDSVQLLAVSKTHPSDAVRGLFSCGQRAFGENYVQEALTKADALSDLDVEWHLIGHLQRNKARHAARLFHVIHSVDSVELAVALSRAAAEFGRSLDVYVQVNVDNEDTKSGVSCSEAAGLCDTVAGLPALRLVGLMAVPLWTPDPEDGRSSLRTMRALRDSLPDGDQLGLSMGMSHDLEVAIAEGATIVRVGTALFGSRQPRSGLHGLAS